MSDHEPPSSPSPGPTRRPRAPTITIDTTAATPEEPNVEQRTPTDLRPSNSFDRDRPTSPHNISSPPQHNLLSVPVPRSRASSLDTDGGSLTSGSGTYVNSSSLGADHGRVKLLDKEPKDVEVLGDEEALKPDPGTEADFVRDNNPFAFTPGLFGKLINPKSLGAFHALGGLDGIEKGLRTDRKSGLSSDEQQLDGTVNFRDATGGDAILPLVNAKKSPTQNFHQPKAQGNSFIDRLRIFSDNRLPERKSKGVLELAWIAYKDKILLLLTGAAVVSLALGLYQTFGPQDASPPPSNGQPGKNGKHGEWIEGVAIMVAIFIVVFVGAINDWQKERQFVKLNRKKEDRSVKAVRSGKTQEISIHDILVGDVLLLEPGDLVPVDGVFIEGHGLKCDESSATGESDLLKKTPADDVWRAMENHESLRKMDPFILSGSKVTEGIGKFMVTATGINSSYGKTMMSLREENDPTPLQVKLNILAEYIAKLGGAAALLLFVVLFIKFLAELRNNPASPRVKGQEFLQIFIVAVTIVVVAVPEGLPLAVTLALAFATKRMTKDHNLVRVLRSCETMGNATTICSDKTGTLTQNVMTVVAGAVGTATRFANRAAAEVEQQSGKAVQDIDDHQLEDVGVSEFLSVLNAQVKESWKESISINSTAFENDQNGQTTFVGSKTETALLQFGRDHLGMGPVEVERANANVVQMFPFDSGRKCMGVVLKVSEGRYRLYVKGASEIMLKHCTKILRDPAKGMEMMNIPQDNVDALSHLIETYASRSLRTIGFIFRDFESWPPRGVRTLEDDRTQARFEDVLKHMTFFGLVGIQDPLRAGVPEAVRDCIRAGVFPRMVTGDNILTAKAIASECGIFTAGGVAMEGPVFRKLSKQQQREIIPKLQVLARSSPEDKRVLVRRLKEMGETVAVTGDGTNDAPALKAADVGFSMGIAGTEVAKEASDIILMDDNFTSIVKALMWGRAVNDAVRKFLQFQVTVNITAVLLAFITAVKSSSETPVLTAVQLLWVNLIMDTFAALALATDPPTRGLLNRKPSPKSAGLFTVTMWKMIIGQAIFQLVVTLILYFGGESILSYQSMREQGQLPTLVFNTFVWMQIFNQLNCRRLDNNFNVFEGLTRNKFFIGINLIIMGGQILIVYVGGSAFSVTRLNGAQWGYSVVLGALSLPVGIIMRLLPDELITGMVPASFKHHKKPKVVVTDEENPFQYNSGIMEIKQELSFIKKYKGGRLNNLRFTIEHPREAILHSRSRSEISLPTTPQIEQGEHSQAESPIPLAPPTSESRRRSKVRSRSNSALAGAAMAGIVAGSIGGWSPITDNTEAGNSLKFARIRSKSDLSKEVPLEVHPDTREEDPVFVENPIQAAGGQPPSQSVHTTPAFPIGPFAGQPRLSTDVRDKMDV
ncbi:calcium-translocating P-type ATPase [Myriangium duriaei CBS 260.36]|uniref:Calcium-transporting ATPase n=1 Tax=Myriangium duriaei CBS 260.36 TaxID=1168546 RepID=A0A9P4MM65_9PEZI|nr:calcium-translocating P-type ATPase [Myriangium duriaei CBS 260.36]